MDDLNSVNDEESQDTGAEIASPFYGSVKEVLKFYTRCEFCGGNLHFSHFTDFGRNITQETAKCPECGLKPKRQLHRLQ